MAGLIIVVLADANGISDCHWRVIDRVNRHSQGCGGAGRCGTAVYGNCSNGQVDGGMAVGWRGKKDGETIGFGRVGNLPCEMTLKEYALLVKESGSFQM